MPDVISEKYAEEPCQVILFDKKAHLIPKQGEHYIDHTFTVPPNVSKVGVILYFEKEEDKVQLYLSLHDPKGFRGHKQCPGASGPRQSDVWICPDDASEGALPGLLPEGEWLARIDFDRLHQEADYRLIAYAECEPVSEPITVDFPEDHVVKQDAGWYKGELHCHSSEGDAPFPVESVVEAATQTALDFLSLSEHFTVSQWRKLASFIDDHQPVAFIRSCEITAHLGHANLQGIKEWVDVYVDRHDWSMNQAAQATHKQGGLFCVNHAFAGYMAWRYFDFDWKLADQIEIYNGLEGCNNDLQIAFWDRLLSSGYRIVGVAGSDSHNPFEGRGKLGQLVTWVYADELSEKGIIEGLRRGTVYVSRGAQLRFTASNEAGESAEMWGSLSRFDCQVTLHVDVLSAEPVRLFIFKDGLLLNHHLVLDGKADEWQTLQFSDTPFQPGYYRIEVHKNTERAGHPEHPNIYWRDYSTVLALSNPVWVGKEPPQTSYPDGR